MIGIGLVVFITALSLVIYTLRQNSLGKNVELRPMPQIQAIEEGVSRSIEVGRPVFYHLDGSLTGVTGTMVYAGLNVVRHVARVCAERGAEFFPFPANAQLTPFADGMVREGCVAAGKPEAYRPVIYRGYQEGSVEAEYFDLHGVGCLVAIGAFYGNHAYLFSEARRQGGIIIAGTARYFIQGSLALQADYPAFMEDIYAIGATVSGDSAARWSLVSSDFLKIFYIGLLLIFLLLSASDPSLLSWLV